MTFTDKEALGGLPPHLVADLSELTGASLEEFGAAFHDHPYGDRAVMAAYGIIAMDPSNGGPRFVHGTEFGLRVAACAANQEAGGEG